MKGVCAIVLIKSNLGVSEEAWPEQMGSQGSVGSEE